MDVNYGFVSTSLIYNYPTNQTYNLYFIDDFEIKTNSQKDSQGNFFPYLEWLLKLA